MFHSTKEDKEEVDYAASYVSTAVARSYANMEISTKIKWILQKLVESKTKSVIVFTTWYAISFFIISIILTY